MNYDGKRSIASIENQQDFGLVGDGPPSKRMRTSNMGDGGFTSPMGIDMEAIRNATNSNTPKLTSKTTISAFRDDNGRVDSIQTGEFLFAVKASESTLSSQNIVVVVTLTQLNALLAETHKKAQLRMQKMRMGEHIEPLDVAVDGQQPARRASDLDVLQRMLTDNPMTPASFSKLVTYLGPVASPESKGAQYADYEGVQGGLRLFVVEHRGDLEVADLWQAQPGEHIGFVVKKMQDPASFRDVNANNIMEKLKPLQVYPCVASLRKNLTQGRRLARSTLVGEQLLSRQDMLDGGITPEELQERMWTSAERCVDWDECTPRTVDASYVDYQVEVLTYPDGSRHLVGNTVLRAGLYLHVGQVRARLGSVPHVDTINSAVLGCVSEDGLADRAPQSAWSSYIGLLNNHRVVIQVQSQHPHTYFTEGGKPF